MDYHCSLLMPALVHDTHQSAFLVCILTSHCFLHPLLTPKAACSYCYPCCCLAQDDCMCNKVSKHASVHLLDILLLQGWQLLITTSHECFESVVKGQQRPQPHTSAQVQPGQASHSSASLVSAVAAVGSQTSVHLHATEVVAELVANISRGELAPTKESNILHSSSDTDSLVMHSLYVAIQQNVQFSSLICYCRHISLTSCSPAVLLNHSRTIVLSQKHHHNSATTQDL